MSTKLDAYKSKLDEVKAKFLEYEANGKEGAALRDETMELALMSRGLMETMGVKDASERLRKIHKEVFNIQIGFDESGLLKVQLPLLYPCSDKNAVFIREPVREALSEFSEKYEAEHGEQYRFQKAVIVFKFYFSPDMPNEARRNISDITNNEVKCIAKELQTYITHTESPFDCSIFICSTDAPESHTDVYVIPFDDFQAWIKKNF